MDNLLFFTPTKKSCIAKLEDLLKVLLKNGLKISLKKYQLFRKTCNIWDISYVLSIGEYVLNH